MLDFITGHGHASLFGKSGRVFHDIHTAKRARSKVLIQINSLSF